VFLIVGKVEKGTTKVWPCSPLAMQMGSIGIATWGGAPSPMILPLGYIEQSVTLIEQSVCKIAFRIDLKRCNLPWDMPPDPSRRIIFFGYLLHNPLSKILFAMPTGS